MQKISFSTISMITTDDHNNIVSCSDPAGNILKHPDLTGSSIFSIFEKLPSNYEYKKIDLKDSTILNSNIKCIYLISQKNNIEDNFYKKILDSSHDEIFVTDGNGIVLYCNNAFEKHYGMKCSEIIGKSVWHLIDNGFCSESPIPIVIEKKKQITLDQETKTGRSLVLTATPVFNDLGEIEMIVENCRNIVEIENIKYKLEKTKKQMEMYRSEVEQLRNIDNNIIYYSKGLEAIFETINRISQMDPNILILGESGTGKSTIASYIHKNSSRKDGPFITINCATISPNLLESELFGYTPGAFTGAKKEGKIGLVELANGGTLFLDEVGEIPLELQAKFLELIQERRFTPVGALKPKSIDVRIISASNQNLEELVKNKKFREDLFYRLKVIDLYVPPLRKRTEDIKNLISYFLNKFNVKYNLSREFTSESISILCSYSWPGNIRELQHIVEQLVITTANRFIVPKNIPLYIKQNVENDSDEDSMNMLSLKDVIEKAEKNYIVKAYNKYGSSYKIAEALGISQSTANRLIRKYIK